MHFFFDAIACGLLAALTWIGLVWMSPNRPIESGKAWVQGGGLVAIANIFVWIALVGLNLRWVPLWAICFLIINTAIASLVFPLCEGIKIPRIWAVVIHPLVIAGMGVLLGGAVGFL
ncbi:MULTISPECIES: hypothetical protein [Pseudanabaena]|jgi:hypothetical protein|uniref:hypothetical protein n=1 Tax=Pseudanabaena TaxID=1152 RepID=UPI002479EAF8|nr:MULTISPECIES: hypothetical protein [Pseudanabaena]MEA5489385.1 hypothetical protein [Pseudanabaena sp. CCNP1317]WGS72795.1 hypothetical protein OA858_01835 [Pseudanabaena galeata CCNP1313]